MYKTVFQNSKVALLFAGMTIFSAVSIVGTPEDKGVLDRTTRMIAAQRETIANDAQVYAEIQSVGDAPPAAAGPDAGWGGTAPVFGDYAPGEPTMAPAPASAASGTKQAAPPAALIPGPQPVVADNEGIPVPGADDRRGPPVITAREMTIQPN